MAVLTPKQQEIREREEHIVDVARELFFEHGYYGLTMAKIAERVGCAKGTIYLHFPSKEDLIVELAMRCLERRGTMARRGLTFKGRTRERIVAVAQGTQFHSRLFPGDIQILHTLNRLVRDNTTRDREEALEQAERDENSWLVSLVTEAVEVGDLELPDGTTPGELAWALWCLDDGVHRVVLSAVSLNTVGVTRPFASFMRVAHRLADSYGWRPFSTEWDYEATLERVRLEIYPEETQKIYALGGEPHG